MDSSNHLNPQFSPDAFAGTARYYSRYRIPYPEILIKDLLKRIPSSSRGVLLDLASGPGRIALQLSPFFVKVLAIDINLEMIAVGKSVAKKRRISNIKWLISNAEELEIEENTIDLITVGEAFHRLDQNHIATLALKWLKPGGCIALMGCYGIFSGNEPWQETIKHIVNKWTSKDFSEDLKSATQNTQTGPEHYRLVLMNNGFVDCNIYSFVYPHYWTIKSILGNLYSTSFCSKKALGGNVPGFQSELTTELRKIDKRGKFFETVRCGYTFGKKPC